MTRVPSALRAPLRSLAEARTLRRGRPFTPIGKVVVITGGAGGIGAAVATELAGRGASVVVVDRDAARASGIAEGLPTRAGVSHLAYACDLTEVQQIRAMVGAVDAAYGRIDVLINNAGMTSSERFGDRSLESMEQEIRLNTLSPLFVTRLALDLLKRSSDPRIISTVSLAGIFPEAETPIYSASKFGLRGAMLSIALDLRSQGIEVSSVLPSATDTPMLWREAIEGGNTLQFQHPPQKPADVVAAVMSLLERPRLEAYPKAGESRLVRAVMAWPNLMYVLLPFFEGKGEAGHKAYVAELLERGAIERVDGQLRVVKPPG